MVVFEVNGFFCFVLKTAQDMENMSDDDGWEFVNLGDQQSFGIKTAGLEEKATACQMLVSNKATLVMCVLLDNEVQGQNP